MIRAYFNRKEEECDDLNSFWDYKSQSWYDMIPKYPEVPFDTESRQCDMIFGLHLIYVKWFFVNRYDT